MSARFSITKPYTFCVAIYIAVYWLPHPLNSIDDLKCSDDQNLWTLISFVKTCMLQPTQSSLWAYTPVFWNSLY